MSPHYEDRWQEILDGKRSWGMHQDADGDPDIFYTNVVVPLRELRDNGVFDKLIEIKRNDRGRSDIARIDIVGAVNLDA